MTTGQTKKGFSSALHQPATGGCAANHTTPRAQLHIDRPSASTGRYAANHTTQDHEKTPRRAGQQDDTPPITRLHPTPRAFGPASFSPPHQLRPARPALTAVAHHGSQAMRISLAWAACRRAYPEAAERRWRLGVHRLRLLWPPPMIRRGARRVESGGGGGQLSAAGRIGWQDKAQVSFNDGETDKETE